MERLENRMVVDSEWDPIESSFSKEISKKINGKGYTDPITGTFVPEEDAFSYAMERVKNGTEKEKEEFTERFYSSWVHEDGR